MCQGSEPDLKTCLELLKVGSAHAPSTGGCSCGGGGAWTRVIRRVSGEKLRRWPSSCGCSCGCSCGSGGRFGQHCQGCDSWPSSRLRIDQNRNRMRRWRCHVLCCLCSRRSRVDGWDFGLRFQFQQLVLTSEASSNVLVEGLLRPTRETTCTLK